MTATPSDAWFDVSPGPRIPTVLAYMSETWSWLRHSFAAAVAFHHDEPVLTDNLCEALSDRNRQFASGMDCDFVSETWILRRNSDGTTDRIARTDIRVTLGAPGTPHLVLEFKKLDGTAGARWRYCFDGVNRFVEGKYAVGDPFGVMCGFSANDLTVEAQAMAAYISDPKRARRLCCVVEAGGNVVTSPSAMDPEGARFDTEHERPTLNPSPPIVLIHTLLPCSLMICTI